jgi:hypothetical protein
MRFDDPNEIREHSIDFVDGIELPCAGSYQVRLTAAGATIMTRPFITSAD